MEYDYNNLTVTELMDHYNKNTQSINYYQNKIKQKNRYCTIFIVIMFFFTLTFAILGIYYVLKNFTFISFLLGFIFLCAHIGIYKATNFNNEEEERINYLKNENEKIQLVLNIKYPGI